MSKSKQSGTSFGNASVKVESVSDIQPALLALEDHLSDWQSEIEQIAKLNDPNVNVFVEMWKQRVAESLSISAACRQACTN